MANTFSLKVIACDRIFFDGRCTQVVLPLHDGEKAIQAHHENMVFAVEIGEIRITDENGKEIPVPFIGPKKSYGNHGNRICPDHQQPCHGAGGYLRIPGGD